MSFVYGVASISHTFIHTYLIVAVLFIFGFNRRHCLIFTPTTLKFSNLLVDFEKIPLFVCLVFKIKNK